jgi:hypothetical protein
VRERFIGGRRELELALDLMQECPQGSVELVADEIVDSFFSEVGQTKVSRKERGEQSVDDFAQRFARGHLDDHAVAPALIVRLAARHAQFGDDST